MCSDEWEGHRNTQEGPDNGIGSIWCIVVHHDRQACPLHNTEIHLERVVNAGRSHFPVHLFSVGWCNVIHKSDDL